MLFASEQMAVRAPGLTLLAAIVWGCASVQTSNWSDEMTDDYGISAEVKGKGPGAFTRLGFSVSCRTTNVGEISLFAETTTYALDQSSIMVRFDEQPREAWPVSSVNSSAAVAGYSTSWVTSAYLKNQERFLERAAASNRVRIVLAGEIMEFEGNRIQEAVKKTACLGEQLVRPRQSG